MLFTEDITKAATGIADGRTESNIINHLTAELKSLCVFRLVDKNGLFSGLTQCSEKVPLWQNYWR